MEAAEEIFLESNESTKGKTCFQTEETPRFDQENNMEQVVKGNDNRTKINS